MNLEWVKKHKYAVAAGVVVVLVLLVVLFRRGSSGSNLTGAITAQNQGQLQMAQLNAQLSAQSEQTQAQLAATEFTGQTQQQEQQTALAGQIAGTVLPIQFESQIYQEELKAQELHQQDILPLEQQALKISTQGNRAQTGQNLLALLEGIPATSLPVQGAGTTSPSGLGLSIPGLGSLGLTFGQGLFG